mgnify:CR=1 FL=1
MSGVITFMELPSEICNIINEYAKPVCRLDWKKTPSPSCIAIYKSDYYRDYRSDIIFSNYLRWGRDVEYIDEDTTWDYWCYWRGVIITEKQRKYGKGFRENGVNRDYTTREAGWWYDHLICCNLFDNEKWVKY